MQRGWRAGGEEGEGKPSYASFLGGGVWSTTLERKCQLHSSPGVTSRRIAEGGFSFLQEKKGAALIYTAEVCRSMRGLILVLSKRKKGRFEPLRRALEKEEKNT